MEYRNNKIKKNNKYDILTLNMDSLLKIFLFFDLLLSSPFFCSLSPRFTLARLFGCLISQKYYL